MTVKACLCLLAASAAVWAQSNTAQINGNVRDDSGSAVPNAAILATQTATGATRAVTSAADGSFILPSLAIGPYKIEISKEGFTKYIQNGIVLQVDSNPTIDANLKVGSINEQVTVQADAAMVETHSTGVGTVIDNQRVVELPLNGRNPMQLVSISGMANAGTGGGALNSIRNYPTIVVSVAGGQGNGNTFLLDGANHNDVMNNLNLPLPFPDALQEFKVETSALPAQYGLHSGAAINAVTKSGTNQYHGDLFEFIRNGDFNARNFFAASRDTLKRNQYGGTIGGPVLPQFRNKLFFFAGYQRMAQRSDPPQTFAWVPTADVLAGDFTTVAGPICNNGRTLTLAAANGFAANRISTSLLNPVALKISGLLPKSADPCGKITYGLVQNQDEYVGLSRVDYQKSDKHSIFLRLSVNDLTISSTYDGKNPITINTAGTHYRIYTMAIGDTYLIGSNIVNSFHTSANRNETHKVLDPFQSWASLGSNVTPLIDTIRLSVLGNGFGVGSPNTLDAVLFTGPNYQFADDLSVVKGSHQFGFGANYIKHFMNFFSDLNAAGTMTFSGQITGLGMADFMVGVTSAGGGTQAFNQGNRYGYTDRQNYIGLYAQDSWKIHPRLTVNYGIRWEPYTPVWSKYGQFVHFDPNAFAQNLHSSVYVNAPAGLFVPGDSQYTAGNGLSNTHWNKFAPRLGLVWDPKGDGRMTIRAAYGLFTDRYHMFGLNFLGQEAPYGNNIVLTSVNMSNPWAAYPGGNPFPLTVSKTSAFPNVGTYVTFPLDMQPMYLNEWNLSIQRQLGKDWLVTANYVGNETTHLFTSNQANPGVFQGLGACTLNGVSYPVCSTVANIQQRRILTLKNPAQGAFYGAVAQADDGGTGSYEGMFLSAQRRMSKGVTLLANYTWSHCISDIIDSQIGSGGASTAGAVPGNRDAYRGNCQTSDQRQVFNLSAVAQTPKFTSRMLRIIAGNWQISPIMSIKSSQFFTVTSGVDSALSGQTGETPNLTGNPYPAKQGPSGWISSSAFAPAAAGTYGNLGYNNIKGPGVFQLDVALSRTFAVHEKKTLQIRAESFNMVNHVNFNTPVATLNSGNFGQITSAADPRIIQLAAKFVF
jgi:Carboxypeptidase regulatory-like domain/TonB dependent receptor